MIEQTNQVGKPNQRTPDGNYPLLKDLFRIHLSPIKNSNTFRVYALQYKKVTKNNTLQWINEGSFGVLQEQYNSEYKGNNFRDISKNYRNQSYEDNDHFHNVKQANPHMNWHKRFQAITHSYIETKMKNTIWRLITGKLYLGDIAQKYLIFRKKPQAALKYEYCPYCSNTFTKSTIQHQFWECPCIQKFWTLIRNLFNQLDITFPLNSFNDLITFFRLEDIKNLESTFKNQLIFNGIFSIWAEYTKLMHEFHTFNQMDAPEIDAYIDNLTQRLINRYNTQNHHSFLSLPYIYQDIHFRSHIKGNLDLTKSALRARFIN